MIAYKRADNPHSQVQGNLPDDFITEWKEVLPGENPPAEEGWRIVPDDQFLKLLEKTNTQENIIKYNKEKQEAFEIKMRDPDLKIKGSK